MFHSLFSTPSHIATYFFMVVALLVTIGFATLTNSPAYAVTDNPLYQADGATFAPDTTEDSQGYQVVDGIRPETLGTM